MTEQTTTENRAEIQRKIVNRLKRAHGQLGALIEAVESGGDCRAVVTQLAAVSAAVNRAGFVIIASGLKHCLGHGDDSADEELTVDDYEKLFMMLA